MLFSAVTLTAAIAAAVTAAAIPTVTIAPGVSLPLISLGTGSGQHGDVANATATWLGLGGTAVDTAYDYKDESEVAKGIALAGSAPFITTKIQCGTRASSAKEIQSNLDQLKMSSVDLMLIHFPSCWGGGSVSETWGALEDAKAAGKTRAIGVSNFSPAQLKQLKKTAKVWPPAVNQCSLSVGYHDDKTIEYCDSNGITYMGYSPLCGGPNGSSCRHGSVMSIPQVQSIAATHNVSAAQVALKWIVQQKRPLATAVWRADYMVEDLDLWSWGELTGDEMDTLTAI